MRNCVETNVWFSLYYDFISKLWFFGLTLYLIIVFSHRNKFLMQRRNFKQNKNAFTRILTARAIFLHPVAQADVFMEKCPMNFELIHCYGMISQKYSIKQRCAQLTWVIAKISIHNYTQPTDFLWNGHIFCSIELEFFVLTRRRRVRST